MQMRSLFCRLCVAKYLFYSRKSMQNNCKNLLKPPTLPLRIQQRAVQINKMAESLNPNFKPVLSLETPLEDYKKLIEQNVEVEGIMDDDLRDENFTKISSAAREAAWKLLFVEQPTTPVNQEKAANLLKQHKMDACFHSPWDYNEWVVTLRDELLKQGKMDFWRNEVVKKELGPCWARDSDFFDDIEGEQPEIEAFYAHCGCVAPFRQSNEASENNAAQNVGTADFVAVISLENPLADYTKLMEEHVLMDYIESDEALAESFSKISAATRETVWKLLFAEQTPTPQNLSKAAELLRKHKSDACFHFPWDYNDWIVKVRDELLKRKMFDFWREQIVKHELGPCWARDSDYFDDMEDTAPEAFYKHAGCVAPFSSEAQNQIAPGAAGSASPAAVAANVPRPVETAPLAAPAKITQATPVEDYKAKMDYQVNLDPDDNNKFNDIFKEAQQVIWDLLFKESALTSVNFEKAAGLLKAYKQDACFYNPHIYNEWILKLRDEIFARKYMDFWKRGIVDQECGLCWYKDSDYFDDTEDVRPIEFYKSGDSLMKQ